MVLLSPGEVVMTVLCLFFEVCLIWSALLLFKIQFSLYKRMASGVYKYGFRVVNVCF